VRGSTEGKVAHALTSGRQAGRKEDTFLGMERRMAEAFEPCLAGGGSAELPRRGGGAAYCLCLGGTS
jgi:hypothetical protein